MKLFIVVGLVFTIFISFLNAQSDSAIDPTIVKNIVSEVQRQKSKKSSFVEYAYPKIVQDNTPTLSIGTNKVENIQKQKSFYERIVNFLNPIFIFVTNYPLQFLTLLASLILILVGFVIIPIMRINKKDENDEIDLNEHIIRKVDSKPEGKVLSSAKFSAIKGRLNESYIYKKEEILFGSDMDKQEREKALLKLEWKYNQLMNFSLSKLDSNNGKIFKEGVKELLSEAESREIIRDELMQLIHDPKTNRQLVKFLEESLRL